MNITPIAGGDSDKGHSTNYNCKVQWGDILLCSILRNQSCNWVLGGYLMQCWESDPS